MASNFIQVTYKCERCGIDKTIDVKVPKTCSRECRLFLLGERQRARKTTRLANQQQMENENVTPQPTDEAGNLIPTPEVPQENGEQPTATEPTPEPTPWTPEETSGVNPGSGSEEGTDNLGRGTTEENRVETPSEPTENPGATEGQA